MRKMIIVLFVISVLFSCVPLPEEINVANKLVVFSLFHPGEQTIIAFVDTMGNLEDTIYYGSIENAHIEMIFRNDTFTLSYDNDKYIYDSLFNFSIGDTIIMTVEYADYPFVNDTTIIPPYAHPYEQNDTIYWDTTEWDLYLIGGMFVDVYSNPPETLTYTYPLRRNCEFAGSLTDPLLDSTLIYVFLLDENYKNYFYFNVLNNAPIEGPDIEEKNYIGVIGSYSKDSLFIK